MTDPYFVCFQSAQVLSLLALLILLVLIWRYRRVNGIYSMIALIIGVFIWTLFSYFETNAVTLEKQILLYNISFLGLMIVPVAWLLFSVNYTAGKRILSGWRIVPFCIFPIAMVIILWNPEWSHLIWYEEHLVQSGPFLITERTYGHLFWVLVIHNYALMGTGIAVLVRQLYFGVALYRGQAIMLLVAVCLPLIWNLVYVYELLPLPQKDFTPVTFAISASFVVLGLVRYNLFMVVPFARKYIYDQMKNGILIFDSQSRLLEANPLAIEILNLSKNDIGRHIDNLSAMSLSLEKLQTAGFNSIELPLMVSGEERTFELEAVSMEDNKEHKVGLLVMLNDITERKQIQEQIITRDRLASIGELTAGVAHEINNPLAIIKGTAELLIQQDLSEDIRRDVESINYEVDRAAEIVENLVTFARRQSTDKILININDVISNTFKLHTSERSNGNITTITDFSPGLPMVLGNEYQLRQVLLNIINNAEYFMIEANGKGKITISTSRVDDSIRIRINDNGPGIPKEDINRIFNPFFTTRDYGKGSGLGLSICHGIVVEHGGSIWAESIPDHGSTFYIELPVWSEE